MHSDYDEKRTKKTLAESKKTPHLVSPLNKIISNIIISSLAPSNGKRAFKAADIRFLPNFEQTFEWHVGAPSETIIKTTPYKACAYTSLNARPFIPRLPCVPFDSMFRLGGDEKRSAETTSNRKKAVVPLKENPLPTSIRWRVLCGRNTRTNSSESDGSVGRTKKNRQYYKFINKT